MKIIVVGGGKVGQTLVEQLNAEGHDITIIDKDPEVVESIISKVDVMGFVGNGASYHIQKEAGCSDANLLIAVTDSDELNLLCCMIAKKSGNCHTIARVRNPEYSRDITSIRSELGLAMVINPELAAAKEASRLMRFPQAISVETFAKGRADVLSFKIKEGSPLANLKLIDLSQKLHCDVLVCGVERNDEFIIPRGNFKLLENDLIFIVASPKKADEFFRKAGLQSAKARRAVIVGGGDVTYYLATELISAGIDVTIIEKDMARCEVLSDVIPKALVIHGDGSDKSVLEEQNVASADGFMAFTDLDEENIMLALYAKNVSQAKIITKINHITFDDLIENLNIGSIVCPKNITAENIIRYVRAMENSLAFNIETLHRMCDDKAEALEFLIREGSPVIGQPLQKLKIRSDVLIGCINRDGEIMIPRGGTEINVDDTVVVITSHTGFTDISEILEEE